jgi:hypothetical protein
MRINPHPIRNELDQRQSVLDDPASAEATTGEREPRSSIRRRARLNTHPLGAKRADVHEGWPDDIPSGGEVPVSPTECRGGRDPTRERRASHGFSALHCSEHRRPPIDSLASGVERSGEVTERAATPGAPKSLATRELPPPVAWSRPTVDARHGLSPSGFPPVDPRFVAEDAEATCPQNIQDEVASGPRLDLKAGDCPRWCGIGTSADAWWLHAVKLPPSQGRIHGRVSTTASEHGLASRVEVPCMVPGLGGTLVSCDASR